MEFSKFKLPVNSDSKSVFKRIIYPINEPFNYMTASISNVGILGPIPNPQRISPGNGPLLKLCSNCLSPAHSWPACNSTLCCQRCLGYGLVSGNCRLLPRSTRFPYELSVPLNSRNCHSSKSLNGGPQCSYTEIFSLSPITLNCWLVFSPSPPLLPSPGVGLGDSRLQSSSTTSHAPLLRLGCLRLPRRHRRSSSHRSVSMQLVFLAFIICLLLFTLLGFKKPQLVL